MCNFAPVRDSLIALGIFTGLASSSALFAAIWQRSGGYPLVTTISYSAAATWALAALITLFFTMGALSTFCSCAAGVPACATACTRIRSTLTTLMGTLFGLFAVCIVAAGDWAGAEWFVYAGVAALAVAAGIIMGVVAYFGNALATCGAP